MDFESFLDSDVIQGEVERNLGGDALHMAVGHMTNNWFPRLPIKAIANITSHLTLSDIGKLHQVYIFFLIFFIRTYFIRTQIPRIPTRR